MKTESDALRFYLVDHEIQDVDSELLRLDAILADAFLLKMLMLFAEAQGSSAAVLLWQQVSEVARSFDKEVDSLATSPRALEIWHNFVNPESRSPTVVTLRKGIVLAVKSALFEDEVDRFDHLKVIEDLAAEAKSVIAQTLYTAFKSFISSLLKGSGGRGAQFSLGEDGVPNAVLIEQIKAKTPSFRAYVLDLQAEGVDALTLSHILGDPFCAKMFRLYAESLYAAEPVLFLERVTEFRECSAKDAPSVAERVWNDFLNPASSSSTLMTFSKDVVDGVKKALGPVADVHLFDAAEAEAKSMLLQSLYPRFTKFVEEILKEPVKDKAGTHDVESAKKRSSVHLASVGNSAKLADFFGEMDFAKPHGEEKKKTKMFSSLRLTKAASPAR